METKQKVIEGDACFHHPRFRAFRLLYAILAVDSCAVHLAAQAYEFRHDSAFALVFHESHDLHVHSRDVKLVLSRIIGGIEPRDIMLHDIINDRAVIFIQ